MAEFPNETRRWLSYLGRDLPPLYKLQAGDLRGVSLAQMHYRALGAVAELTKEYPPEMAGEIEETATRVFGHFNLRPEDILSDKEIPTREKVKAANISARTIEDILISGSGKADRDTVRISITRTRVEECFARGHNDDEEGIKFRAQLNGRNGQLGVIRSLMPRYEQHLPIGDAVEEWDINRDTDQAALPLDPDRNVGFLINAEGRTELAYPHFLIPRMVPAELSENFLRVLDPELANNWRMRLRSGLKIFKGRIIISTDPKFLSGLNFRDPESVRALSRFGVPAELVSNGIIGELEKYK